MSSIGTGYDLSATTYSPDGRVFQIDYASKAVEGSGTCVGLRVKDGVVLGVEKLLHSKLLVPGANHRIATADTHLGIAVAGLVADGRHLIGRIRSEALNYRRFYESPVPGFIAANKVAHYMHAYTLYSGVRPFGASILLAAMDSLRGPQLYMVEPSGVYFGFHGCAIGKAHQAAKTEIEKLVLTDMTAREAVVAVARIIYQVHDELKDKEFELELSWVCEESKGRHEFVPLELFQDAERQAKLAAQEEMAT
jgi:20S proteasome subunit alpha 7